MAAFVQVPIMDG
ncbi:hypothetical protein J005_02097 [Cryptococcus neoformans]|nr:hypothetical protein C344_02073 [Cryptococcus neoformans var. grubii AD1-7a]OXH35632.1 hypothetical protein J005_02098 [Cryptococcus neoformans var. grubii]OXH35634.1 hypothetical protein J005_02097 [Cryptococcus neoformans var. grubii]